MSTARSRLPATRDWDLEQGLALAQQLLAEHLAAVTNRYGNYGLGIVDLPSLDDVGRVVPAQVAAGAVLYWCSALERAAVLPFVEGLAQLMLTGRLQLPLQRGGVLLQPFWRDAQYRFSASERETLYRLVLDGGLPGGFERALAQVAVALARIGRAEPDRDLLALQTRAAYRIYDLAVGLSDRAVGIAAFAARNIVRQVSDALNVLDDPEVNRALGGGPVAMVLSRWGPRVLGKVPAVSRYLQLALSGSRLLQWMAQGAGDVRGNARVLTRDHPAVHAAEAWLVAFGEEAE